MLLDNCNSSINTRSNEPSAFTISERGYKGKRPQPVTAPVKIIPVKVLKDFTHNGRAFVKDTTARFSVGLAIWLGKCGFVKRRRSKHRKRTNRVVKAD